MMADTTTTPTYLIQAQDSSLSIQRQWIQSVLRKSASIVLRKLVLDRTLSARTQKKQRRQREDYDDSSISSIEDEHIDPSSRTKDDDNVEQEEEEEVVVTQEDIDMAYQFAERVGRKWAQCLAGDHEGGAPGIESSADLVLEVVEAGRFLEEEEDEDEEKEEERTRNEVESTAAAAAAAAASAQDTTEAVALAKAEEAILPETALARLTTPPALLIGNTPFGKPLERLPPNPIISAMVATMVNTDAADIKAKNEEADQWRQSQSEKIDKLGRDGKTRWMYPWDVVERASDHNLKRLESSRNAAIKNAEIASGRAAPSSADGDAESSRSSTGSVNNMSSRKRRRLDSAPILPRPASAYSSQEWTISDILESLSVQDRRVLEEELLHVPPEYEEGEQEKRREPSPLPPTCIISGHLQHLGATQLWEKSKVNATDVKDDGIDTKKARRKRKRMYRKAKFQRMGGDRAEKAADARLEIDERLSKVVRATEGDGGEEGPEWFELDLGGCLVEVENEDKKVVMTFRSMEASLSLES